HASCHTRGAALRPLHGSVVIPLYSTAERGRNGNFRVDAAAPVALPCGQQLGEQNYTELLNSSSAACVLPQRAGRKVSVHVWTAKGTAHSRAAPPIHGEPTPGSTATGPPAPACPSTRRA